jgi:hypothetical protein
MRIRLTRDSKRVLDEWGARLGTARPKRKVILNGLIHAYSYQGDRICTDGVIDFNERQPIPTDKEFTLSKEIEHSLEGLLQSVLQRFGEDRVGRRITHTELVNQLIMLSKREQESCWRPLRDFVLSGIKENPNQIYLELSDEDWERASISSRDSRSTPSTAGAIAKRLDDFVASSDTTGLRQGFQNVESNQSPRGRFRIVVLSVREETKQRLSAVFDSDFEPAVRFLVRKLFAA